MSIVLVVFKIYSFSERTITQAVHEFDVDIYKMNESNIIFL